MMLEGLLRGARSALVLITIPAIAACGQERAGEAAEAPGSEQATAAAVREGDPTQAADGSAGATSTPALGTAWVVFGTEEDADTIFAEVARTADERAEGLMYREELAENAGMLFVFQDVAERAFWMQNTFIPLDIAYLDPSFRIIDIKPMEPESDDLVESSGPAQYALEVNRGWFEAHGVSVGQTPRIFFGM